jgi:integrase
MGDRNTNTVISKVKTLRTVANFALEEGWLERSPSWRRVLPRGSIGASKVHYSHDQVVSLLEHLRDRGMGWRDRRLYSLASTVAYTGLRAGEALRLQVEDVDFSARLLFVVPRRRLKTVGSAAPVPMHGELAEVLEEWVSRSGTKWVFPGERGKGPWLGGAPGYKPLDKLRAAGREVEIERLTFHGLRHTLAKLLVGRFGATRDQARGVLRHSDVRTTEDHYLHADDAETLHRAIRNVTFRRPS